MTPRAQKQFFEDNGYLIVEDLLRPTELAEMRRAYEGIMDGAVKPDTPNTHGSQDDFDIQWEPAVKDNPAIPRRDKIRVVFHLCHTHPLFRAYATSARLLDVVENLIGPNIKLYTDQTFFKPARHGSEVPYHQDSGYWPMWDPPALLSCWLAIDDATIENGCMHMIPGSHKKLLPHHRFEGPQSMGLFENEVDAKSEVPIAIKAGSMSIHHSCTVHRSSPNRSDRSRRALITIFMPATTRHTSDWRFHYGLKLVRGREHAGCV